MNFFQCISMPTQFLRPCPQKCFLCKGNVKKWHWKKNPYLPTHPPTTYGLKLKPPTTKPFSPHKSLWNSSTDKGKRDFNWDFNQPLTRINFTRNAYPTSRAHSNITSLHYGPASPHGERGWPPLVRGIYTQLHAKTCPSIQTLIIYTVLSYAPPTTDL